MFKKTLKVIITFSSTSESLKMEKICRKNSIKGRLIPDPREISAGCGMAWSSEVDLKDELLKIIDNNNIKIEKMYELMK